MNTTDSEAPAFRITSAGHALFAAAMIWLGVMGLSKGDFAQIWSPVPKWVPAHQPLAYLCGLVSLAGGIGLLWRRTAFAASRVIFAALLVWLLTLRVPFLFFQKPLVLVGWSFGATAIMVAAAWVLYVRLAHGGSLQRDGFIVSEKGVRVARVLFGLSLIPFGFAHFLYVDATTVLIPAWLPWHAGWAYFTGATFVAAGLAVIFSVFARAAATLATLQFALFGLIVWIPRVIAGTLNPFQWGEFVTTCALTAGGLVVAESYGDAPWLWWRSG